MTYITNLITSVVLTHTHTHTPMVTGRCQRQYNQQIPYLILLMSCIFFQSIYSLIFVLNKAQFMTVSNSYMFRHRGAILRESSRTKNTSPAR
jgi:hypothetical protein